MPDDLFALSRYFLGSANRPYRRYFLRRYPLENRFSIIIGPRGVGKTTATIQHLISKYDGDIYTEKALYIPVDHFAVGKSSLYEMAEDFSNLGGELICFDEIHKYAHWSGELKSIHDRFPRLKIVASGSSALRIQRGTHDLSRRAIVYRMAGLSFREYLDLILERETEPFALETILENHSRLAGTIVESVDRRGKKILALFKAYLQSGYFPYFQEYDDVSLYHITLEQSIHTTIENDLLAIHPMLTGSSIQKLKKLLAVIAESAPFTPDMRRLRQIVEIGDERTLKAYLQYLEDGGVILNLLKSGGGLRAMEKPAKIYLHNPNQVYAISSRGRENIGNIRETYFVNMLSVEHLVSVPKQGDFLVDNRYTFEIGGKNKGFKQIAGIPDSYLAIDDVEMSAGNKIPLWLFGFLY
jgi:uncharacterized protein